ncbi:asparaginase [Allosaccharopolyspora coralli]|uniref:Asparaginase n=1 Tax=Allosaccharopolyspora coralli TaxID=2665642 RepID=A0A5Q3QCY3_9PSEU|nr:asparaginase [Allosaccharopolyspora coralli]QGK71760.1 asparaginase [Allosaccharopolyspora coralli]
MTEHVPLVEVVRGGLREGVHHGSVVVVDRDGSIAWSRGEVETPMFPRSSSKPAQALGMLRSGLTLPDDADLALAAASHSGETAHVSRVREMLHRHGLSEADLHCPPDWPMHEPSRDAMLANGLRPQRVTMNCSGKHAAMLATCVQRGWSTTDYLDPKHPLQVSVHEAVVDLAGEPTATSTVDGCGAPLFAISLAGLARMYSALATAGIGTRRRRIADAMRAHPWLVSGTDREDVELMGAVPGLLSKIGAEGVLAVALPDGRAMALKIADGADRARLPLAIGVLRTLDVANDVLDALAESPVLGGGVRVGSVRVLR